MVYSGLAIYDTMQHMRTPVSTMCVGMAASMAAILLASGKKGRRVALPSARILIHQPHGGARGQVTDIEIQAREVRHLKDTLTGILAAASGKPREVLAADMERDNYMSAAVARSMASSTISSRRAGSPASRRAQRARSRTEDHPGSDRGARAGQRIQSGAMALIGRSKRPICSSTRKMRSKSSGAKALRRREAYDATRTWR